MDNIEYYNNITDQLYWSPGLTPSLYTGYTQSDMTNTDLLPGKMAINVYDDRIWYAQLDGVTEILSSSNYQEYIGTGSSIECCDTIIGMLFQAGQTLHYIQNEIEDLQHDSAACCKTTQGMIENLTSIVKKCCKVNPVTPPVIGPPPTSFKIIPCFNTRTTFIPQPYITIRNEIKPSIEEPIDNKPIVPYIIPIITDEKCFCIDYDTPKEIVDGTLEPSSRGHLTNYGHLAPMIESWSIVERKVVDRNGRDVEEYMPIYIEKQVEVDLVIRAITGYTIDKEGKAKFRVTCYKPSQHIQFENEVGYSWLMKWHRRNRGNDLECCKPRPVPVDRAKLEKERQEKDRRIRQERPELFRHYFWKNGSRFYKNESGRLVRA